MNSTSSQDEFAKWAKLRREHDKAVTKYDEQGQNKCFLLDMTCHMQIAQLLKINLLILWLTMSLPCCSIVPERIQRHIRPRCISRTLARHKWYAHDFAILVLKDAVVLDAARMGTVVYRVATGISKSSAGECEHTDLGYSLCNCNSACWRGGSGNLGFGSGRRA